MRKAPFRDSYPVRADCGGNYECLKGETPQDPACINSPFIEGYDEACEKGTWRGWDPRKSRRVAFGSLFEILARLLPVPSDNGVNDPAPKSWRRIRHLAPILCFGIFWRWILKFQGGIKRSKVWLCSHYKLIIFHILIHIFNGASNKFSGWIRINAPDEFKSILQMNLVLTEDNIPSGQMLQLENTIH